MEQPLRMQRQTDLLSHTGLWCCLINDKRDRGKERGGGELLMAEYRGRKSPLWVYKTGLLMLKWQGLYLHSDMLSNGGGGKKEKCSLLGNTLERTILFLSLRWHQTNAVI